MDIKDWLEKEDRSINWLSRQLKKSPSWLGKIVNKHKIPTLKLVYEIYKLTEGEVDFLDFIDRKK